VADWFRTVHRVTKTHWLPARRGRQPAAQPFARIAAIAERYPSVWL